MSVALGVLAAALRVGVDRDVGRELWSALPWLAWALAAFCLLMLRFEPVRGWVHLAVGLTGLGFAATLAPWVQPAGWWLSASMALACFWWLAARGAERFEGAFRRTLGIVDGRDSEILDDWSHAAFGLASIALVVAVVVGIFDSSSIAPGRWFDGLLAIGLAAGYVGLAGRRFGRDAVWIGFEVVGLLLVWWLASADSPLPGRIGFDRNAYLPLATSVYALMLAWLGIWDVGRSTGGVVDPSEGVEPPRRVGLVEWTSGFVVALGMVSAYFSVLMGGWVAFGTLLLVSAASGLLAMGWNRVEAAIEGGVTWCLAWPVGQLLVARWSERFDSIGQTRVIALGFASALFSLWWAAGWVEAPSGAKGRGVEPSEGRRVALAMEWVAIGATVPATLSSP